MNIYAVKGFKVVCTNLNAGYPSDELKATEFLELGKVYTISYTRIYNWQTDVHLEEFPNESFNSVFFEDLYPKNTKTKLNSIIKKAQKDFPQKKKEKEIFWKENKEREERYKNDYY